MSSQIIPNVNKNYLKNLFSQIFSNPNSPILRPDHRTPNQYREIKISRLTQSFNSPINVNLGKTQIFSQINAKLVSPKIERPSEGIINFQVDTHHL
jgi:exosome complex RNA-binding protein Rrp42 (RNase PH superfamily)